MMESGVRVTQRYRINAPAKSLSGKTKGATAFSKSGATVSEHRSISTSKCQTPGFTASSQSGEDDLSHGGCCCLAAQTGQPFFQPGPFGPGFKPHSMSPKA